MQKIKNNKKQVLNKETITIQPKNKEKYVQTISNTEQDTIIEQDNNNAHLQKEKKQVNMRIDGQEEKEEQRGTGVLNEAEIKWIEEKLKKLRNY